MKPEILVQYREFIIQFLEEKGFSATKTQRGDLAIIGAYARFSHADLPLHIWISQQYARIFRSERGKKTDIDCFALTEARKIVQTITEQLAAKP